MKVAIGYHLQDGPWGGGNQFARSLAQALERKGDQVRFDLRDNDIDLIVLTDPRERSPSVSFGAGAILRYLLLRNPRALVVHRINECDERKGTRHMNRLLRRANYVADHTVFIATWLKDLSVWERQTPHSVILNGADTRFFNPAQYRPWDGTEPLRLVTHHWGGNRLKGFDVYEELDRLLIDPAWAGKIAFTYVGNLPVGVMLPNTRYLSPLDGEALGRELAAHHVYVTGSVNEPAGMHHIEGALCGLPLLYRRSGALPEYCEGFGVGFDSADFIPALHSMLNQYTSYADRMRGYCHTAEHMCEEYIALFERLMSQQKSILASRRLLRNPFRVLRNQIPL